jgi:trypsin
MALAILLAGGVAQAIINGEPDRGPNAHPYVGAYVAKVEGELLPVCSGTLISPRVFLTAGHCTEFEIEKDRPVYVSFDPTYKPRASEVIKATPYNHPGFCFPTPEDKGKCRLPPKYPEILGAPNRVIRYDVGVAVLDQPVSMATYGALPKAGVVDTLKEGQRLTTVGYGASGFDIGGGLPPQLQPVYLDERYSATVRLRNPIDPAIDDQSVKTSGIGIRGGGEGSCYGDSGGPLFMPDQETIVGVTSGGLPLCKGPAYYQRMDLPGVLSWVRSFP